MNLQKNECSDCTSFYYLKPVPTVLSRPIDSDWNLRDYLGAIKMRFSLKRNNYLVTPGLYCINHPSDDSPVLVTSNYKLTFDILRKNLTNVKAWIIVLDTKGINVWCAAGKGTFGTKELISKIESTHIKDRINHKKIIIPQLGTPGISAHKVKKATELDIEIGPVYAKDIKDYLKSGSIATNEMRKTRFNLCDRLILTGVEIVYSLRFLLIGILLIAGIYSFGQSEPFSTNYFMYVQKGGIYIAMAIFTGTFFGPLLLPYLPTKSFAVKGAAIGLLLGVLIFVFFFKNVFSLEFLAYFILSISLGSYFTLNFTGATTFTSLTGVKKEMKLAFPLQILTTILGLSFLLISRFI